MTHLFSVDVEEHFQVAAFDRVLPRSAWEAQPSRVEANTDRILALLADHRVLATFFTLGWVAERKPGLIRRIAAQGHEIASHTCWHRKVFQSTVEDFREEVRRSKAILEDLSGTPVRGFRAPRTGDKTEKVDLWIAPGDRRVLVSAKWSVRSDREKQMRGDFLTYVTCNELREPFEYIWITNEFDPARLVANATFTWTIPRGLLPDLATPGQTFMNLRATTDFLSSTADVAFLPGAAYVDQAGSRGCTARAVP